MKVELTTVKLEGLQIFGAKTQRHLTQSDQCFSFMFELNENVCQILTPHFSVFIMCSELHDLV